MWLFDYSSFTLLLLLLLLFRVPVRKLRFLLIKPCVCRCVAMATRCTCALVWMFALSWVTLPFLCNQESKYFVGQYVGMREMGEGGGDEIEYWMVVWDGWAGMPII